MKKRIALFLVCLALSLSLAVCGTEQKHNAADFIGKTSAQIEAEYGPFDCCGMPAGEDGLYRSTSCGYTIQEPKQGIFGKSREWLIFIRFNGKGVAYDTYGGYRPGG